MSQELKLEKNRGNKDGLTLLEKLIVKTSMCIKTLSFTINTFFYKKRKRNMHTLNITKAPLF